MIRSPRTLLVVAAACFLLLGCDTGGGITIVTEVEESFDFETGLEGWVLGSSDLGAGQGDLDATQEEASSGSGSAALRVETADAGGMVWMEREFQLGPGKRYEVTLAFDFSSADGPGVTAWGLVAGGGSQQNLAPVLTMWGDTGVDGGTTRVWERRSVTFEARAGAGDGILRIGLGVEAETVDARSYFVDELDVELVRLD